MPFLLLMTTGSQAGQCALSSPFTGQARQILAVSSFFLPPTPSSTPGRKTLAACLVGSQATHVYHQPGWPCDYQYTFHFPWPQFLHLFLKQFGQISGSQPQLHFIIIKEP
jgi:hypothetical protein